MLKYIMTLSAFKTRVHVNNKQHDFFMQCVNARRVAFNFALGTWIAMYDAHKLDETKPKPSAFDIDKVFNAVKKQKYPWLYGDDNKLIVPSCVAQQGIVNDLKLAFKNFFERVKKGGVPGYPKFKKRGMNDSFKFTTSVIKNQHLIGNKLLLPKDYGSVRLGQKPHDGIIKNTTFSYRGGKWWVSLLLEHDEVWEQSPSNTPIGIDMGIAQYATLSDGTVYPSARALESNTKKLVKLQRKLAKMTKGSARHAFQKEKISKHHKKISDIRVNHAHQVTAEITQKHDVIVIEDLKLKNMTKSSKGTVEEPGKMVKQKSGLNRSLLNQGLFEFRRQLDYKTARHGGVLIPVNPRFTSQTCFMCGAVDKENRQSQAVFKCVHCGHVDHADLNASKNILQIGMNSTAS
jgi:putative transposase